jgi:hypothetical protein
MDPEQTKREIADLEHRAAVARQSPHHPREAEERRRQADQLDQEAQQLRAALAEHQRGQRAANQAARDANQVLVRFTRDLTADCLIGDVTVPAARGPVRQRRTSSDPGSGHPLGTTGGDVVLEDGEVRELPGQVAQVLLDGGYVQVLTDPAEVKQARAELAAAARQEA